eukprot:TRINITY_DN31141_c0_g1_i1.p1 TRINITY_DN31141_c0_g1~~TRINITY_DN31141_c0_g1_i1.p1  ORF type:complete len:116 (-),score=9.92 TRINITY_DN31141_c0_g1_i1:15-362(-)
MGAIPVCCTFARSPTLQSPRSAQEAGAARARARSLMDARESPGGALDILGSELAATVGRERAESDEDAAASPSKQGTLRSPGLDAAATALHPDKLRQESPVIEDVTTAESERELV